MGKGAGLGIVRATPVLKIYGNVLKQPLLIALGGKVVMSLAIFYKMTAKFTLSQQCIASHHNTFKVDACQQWSGYLYFIGLLEVITSGDRDEANFFWA